MSDDDRSDGDDANADPFDDDLFGDGPRDEADDPLEEPDADEVDDPFAALGDGVDEGGDPLRDDARGSDGVDASSWADPEPGASADSEPGAPADDPFAELDADAAGAPTDEDPFESMGGGDVGEEDVWEALDEGTPLGADATEFGDAAEGGAIGDVREPDSGHAGPTPGPGAAGDERVVDKRSYCQRCPHFTAPPETACTHEGTEIVESVDFSRFRVRNCPMIDTEDPAFDGE